MISIVDTYEQIEKFLSMGSFEINAWKRYLSGISAALFNRIVDDVKNYDYDRQIFPVMQNLYRKRALADDVCDFFGDWRNFEGYSDIGYYLGAEVVRYASKVLDVDSLINLKLEQFEDYLKKF